MIQVRHYEDTDFDELYQIIQAKFLHAIRHNTSVPEPLFLIKDKMRSNMPKDMLVASIDNELVGFFGGYHLDDIDSHRNGFLTTLSLHGVKEGHNKRFIIYKLIQESSRLCVQKGIYNLAVLVHAYDDETKDILFDLGYGGLTIDLIRGTDLIPVKPMSDIIITEVDENDLKPLMPLFVGIQDHLMGSPIFLYDDNPYNPILHYYTEQLKAGGNGLFMAMKSNNPVGYIKYTTTNVNRQELNAGKTIGINGAFVLPEHRGQKIMDHLLNKVIEHANNIGFTHIMTDCETANFEAVHFWKKHFVPYSYGLFRHINELKK